MIELMIKKDAEAASFNALKKNNFMKFENSIIGYAINAPPWEHRWADPFQMHG